MQTLKMEYRGRPVGSGYLSYTMTPWGALPSFWDPTGVESKVGVQVLEKMVQPNKKIDPDAWYSNMVEEAKVRARYSTN